jgi:hypothetical protein
MTAWDEEIEENERLGLHARMHACLLAHHPGPDVDANEFFGSIDPTSCLKFGTYGFTLMRHLRQQ